MTMTSIIMIVIMALVIEMGSMVTFQKVSAVENNVVRYINGQNDAWQTAGWQYLNNHTAAQLDHFKNLDLIHMGTPEFQKHTEAYRNGFIGEIDSMYHLQLPYVEYNLETPTSHNIDKNMPVTVTPHYMGI